MEGRDDGKRKSIFKAPNDVIDSSILSDGELGGENTGMSKFISEEKQSHVKGDEEEHGKEENDTTCGETIHRKRVHKGGDLGGGHAGMSKFISEEEKLHVKGDQGEDDKEENDNACAETILSKNFLQVEAIRGQRVHKDGDDGKRKTTFEAPNDIIDSFIPSDDDLGGGHAGMSKFINEEEQSHVKGDEGEDGKKENDNVCGETILSENFFEVEAIGPKRVHKGGDDGKRETTFETPNDVIDSFIPSDGVLGVGHAGMSKFISEEQQSHEKGDQGEDDKQENDKEVNDSACGETILSENFFEVEAIRGKRMHKGQVQYLIKWSGWPETTNTWEPLENLENIADDVQAFEERLKSRKHYKGKRKLLVHHTQHKKSNHSKSVPPLHDDGTEATPSNANKSVPDSRDLNQSVDQCD